MAFEGALEKLMHAVGMFDRASHYSMEGFENSGADFMPEYKKYIEDGKTMSPRRTKCMAPRLMIWCCNCARTMSIKSS